MNNKRYSKKEENVVFNAVKANPGNLHAAFRHASGIIGRSTASISTTWYARLRNDKKAFSTVSNSKNLKNTKNIFSTKNNAAILQITNGKLDLGNGKSISGNFVIHL